MIASDPVPEMWEWIFIPFPFLSNRNGSVHSRSRYQTLKSHYLSYPLLLGGQRRLGDGPSAQLELVPWSGSP